MQMSFLDAEGFVTVKVSAAMMRQKFNGCDPDFITNVCHAACCRSSTGGTDIFATVTPGEEPGIISLGAVVANSKVLPRDGETQCPFIGTDSLCTIHFTPYKPMGCIISPFQLTNRNTLVVRNRYRRLKCYNYGKKIPAYRAFRASLVLLFGEDEVTKLTKHLDDGGGDIYMSLSLKKYNVMKFVHGVYSPPQN